MGEMCGWVVMRVACKINDIQWWGGWEDGCVCVVRSSCVWRGRRYRGRNRVSHLDDRSYTNAPWPT